MGYKYIAKNHGKSLNSLFGPFLGGVIKISFLKIDIIKKLILFIIRFARVVIFLCRELASYCTVSNRKWN